MTIVPCPYCQLDTTGRHAQSCLLKRHGCPDWGVTVTSLEQRVEEAEAHHSGCVRAYADLGEELDYQRKRTAKAEAEAWLWYERCHEAARHAVWLEEQVRHLKKDVEGQARIIDYCHEMAKASPGMAEKIQALPDRIAGAQIADLGARVKELEAELAIERADEPRIRVPPHDVRTVTLRYTMRGKEVENDGGASPRTCSTYPTSR